MAEEKEKRHRLKPGQPPKYETAEEIQKAIDLYLSDATVSHKTVCGLALALGFCDRQSLYDYKNRPEFSCIIKKALLQIENGYELLASEGKNVAGPIFVLKNMGWKDKQEVEHSGTVSIAQQIKAAYDKGEKHSE